MNLKREGLGLLRRCVGVEYLRENFGKKTYECVWRRNRNYCIPQWEKEIREMIIFLRWCVPRRIDVRHLCELFDMLVHLKDVGNCNEECYCHVCGEFCAYHGVDKRRVKRRLK
jgi:hypothetical protein